MASAVLSDRDILEELKPDGGIVIEPFNRQQLSNCSYDVTLGKYYYIQRHTKPSEEPQFFCPWNDEHRANYWDEKYSTAIKVMTEEAATKYGVKVGDEIIVIPPNATILAHTNEYIGGRHNVTTMMHARSSMGRCCVTICKDAGWGDISYVQKWTLEVQNTGHKHLVLIVGERVGQIIFFRSSTPINSYEKKGSYQSHSPDNMAELMASWNPAMMLPKLKRDKIQSTLPPPLPNPLPLPDDTTN